MIFVTGKKLDFSPVIRDLTAEFPELETVAVNYHTTKSSEIYGDKTEIIWGKETIQEGVLDYEFSLSPRAFTSSIQSRQKCFTVKQSRRLMWHLKSIWLMLIVAWGTIGFAFAKRVKSLRGMDIIPEAIEDAKRNAARLGF